MLHPLEEVRDHQNPLAHPPALASRQAPQLCRPQFAAKEVCRHRPPPQTWYAYLITLPHLGITGSRYYVVPDFAWVQDVGGSLMVLADQVRRAIAWVYESAAHLGIDPNQLYIGGQSSDGHLAAVALTTDWPRDFGLPADIIKGGMCISGMYDLTPVRLSARKRLCHV